MGGQRYAPFGGEELERYAQTLSRLVLAARLNKWFPDPFSAAERLRLLAPSCRRGVYPGVYFDRVSGLPSFKDVLSVQADWDLAGDFIREQEARLAAGRALTPKVQAKLAYYRELVKVCLSPVTSLELSLRRVFPERRAAAYRVVFDRFDMGEGVFARYTLLLEQSDEAYGSRLLERSGDYSQQTNAFRATMEKVAQDESEILFLVLGRREGVKLEEVTRGRIGPFWSPWAPPPDGWFPPDPRECFALHCPLDSASVAWESSVDEDPFSRFFKDFLSPESRPLVEEAAKQLGYKVHKERKFACTPAAAAAVQVKLREAGTRNMVYTL